MAAASLRRPGLRPLLANAASLGLSVGGVLAFGLDPRVFVFSFFLTYAGQLALIGLLLRLHRRRPDGSAAAALDWLTRPPAPGQVSRPLVEEGSGRTLRLGGYLLVWAGMAFFAFVLAHVNARRELDFAWAPFGREFAGALALTGIYLVQDLAGRRLTVDFSAPAEVNLGYHSSGMGMLGCAVLFAGALVVVRQSLEAGASGWVVAGPLVALKHLDDLFVDAKRGPD